MLVADEGVAAVMGVWMVGVPCPSPPRAYPALLSVLWAPLARAPFALRKGAD